MFLLNSGLTSYHPTCIRVHRVLGEVSYVVFEIV